MNYFSRALLLAPFIFVCHFLEESPGFVAWFNAHVSRGITSGLFWTVNISALVITLMVVGLEWFSRSAFSLSLALIWLSFLMLANAIFHVVGALVDKQYVPGLATAILLYLPYYSWLFMRDVESRRITVAGLIVMVVLGSLPMLIHGLVGGYYRVRVAQITLCLARCRCSFMAILFYSEGVGFFEPRLT